MTGIVAQQLGNTCTPSALVYLDDGVLYVGSLRGDPQVGVLPAGQTKRLCSTVLFYQRERSAGILPILCPSEGDIILQLVRLLTEANEEGSYVDVLEEYPNLGPVVDLCVMDPEGNGQDKVWGRAFGFLLRGLLLFPSRHSCSSPSSRFLLVERA